MKIEMIMNNPRRIIERNMINQKTLMKIDRNIGRNLKRPKRVMAKKADLDQITKKMATIKEKKKRITESTTKGFAKIDLI